MEKTEVWPKNFFLRSNISILEGILKSCQITSRTQVVYKISFGHSNTAVVEGEGVVILERREGLRWDYKL